MIDVALREGDEMELTGPAMASVGSPLEGNPVPGVAGIGGVDDLLPRGIAQGTTTYDADSRTIEFAADHDFRAPLASIDGDDDELRRSLQASLEGAVATAGRGPAAAAAGPAAMPATPPPPAALVAGVYEQQRR